MTANILIIEDDEEIGKLISLYLKKEGIAVSHVLSGEEGLTLLKKNKYDLLVLDLNLPGMDGYEVLQEIRGSIDIPILIVSARIDDADMILGFGYGADDFVPKPFSSRVLSARIRAHLRRDQRLKTGRKDITVTFGDFVLNVEDLILRKNNKRISVSPMEMALLCSLVSNAGKPVSQEKLYNQVWGNTYGDLATVSVHIQRLRKKIEKDPSAPKYIQTVYGFGYMFKDEDKG